jgi:membrane-associated protein
MVDLQSVAEAFGIVGVAAMVFAESGLFFGFIFPGDSLLFTAGFLSSQGHFGIIPLILLCAVAAIAGDSVGYWFGKKVGPHIFTRPDSFWFSHKRVEDAHAFFEKRGPSSLVLARFIPAVRTFTPIVAGVAGMRYGTFLAYNVIGGILWGVGIPLSGYFLGTSVPGIDRYIVAIVGLIVVVSLLPLMIEFFKRREVP